MTLPQLEELPIIENTATTDDVSKSWKCLCCCDTGEVKPHLIKKVIPTWTKKLGGAIVICQHLSDCIKEWHHMAYVDNRFTPEICKELHRQEIDEFKRLTEYQEKINQRKIKEELENIGRM